MGLIRLGDLLETPRAQRAAVARRAEAARREAMAASEAAAAESEKARREQQEQREANEQAGRPHPTHHNSRHISPDHARSRQIWHISPQLAWISRRGSPYLA